MLKKIDKYFSIILICISVLFYLFFAVYDGAVIGADSESYINMHVSREPFYCIFLAFLRSFVGIFTANTELYLTFAVYIQSLLAAFAAWCLADYLKKELELSNFLESIILFITFAVSLLCRFAAKRASMYSNSILTEGIACSLFLIFTKYLLEFYYKKNFKYVIISSVISLVLIATRKQMYITLILLIIVIGLTYFPKKQIRIGIVTIVISTFCVLSCNTILDNSYNLIAHGELGTHSSDNRFLATMVIYSSERSDGEKIADGNARELFYQIYDVCNDKGYLKHNAGTGWNNRVEHFGNNYDRIQIDTMWPMIQQYVYANYEGGTVYLEQKVDEMTNQIIMGLMPKVWPKVIGCFIDNFLSGLITTVAQRKPILTVYSFMAYIIYFAMLTIQIRLEGITKLSFLATYTMLSIIINVAVVSMVIFCQTRYAIYNMPLFYISFCLLFLKNVSLILKNTNDV